MEENVVTLDGQLAAEDDPQLGLDLGVVLRDEGLASAQSLDRRVLHEESKFLEFLTLKKNSLNLCKQEKIERKAVWKRYISS